MILRKYRRKYPEKEWETVKAILHACGVTDSDKRVDGLRKSFESNCERFERSDLMGHVESFSQAQVAATFAFNEYWSRDFKLEYDHEWRDQTRDNWVKMIEPVVSEIEAKIWPKEAIAKRPDWCWNYKGFETI